MMLISYIVYNPANGFYYVGVVVNISLINILKVVALCSSVKQKTGAINPSTCRNNDLCN